MRGLKFLVYAMGLTLTLGCIAIVVLIATRMHPPETTCHDGPVAMPPHLQPMAMQTENGHLRVLAKSDDGQYKLIQVPCP